jgi:cytochrome c-type biogenesis protein CcmH
MQSWIILSILTAAGVALLLVPVLRGSAARAAPDVEASLDRLMAIEQRAAAGDLSAGQAAAARAEVRRRILWTHRAVAPARLAAGERKRSTAALAGGAMIGAVAFYLAYDSLDLSDGRIAPAAVHQDDRTGVAAVEALAAATAQTRALPLAIQQDGAPQRALAGVDEMIERLAARLKGNPKDPEGWRMLGWSYFNTDRFEAAAGAYAKAVDLDPHKADLRSAYGEALVRAAGGTVTDEARSAFQEALRRDGKDSRARFFIGMRKAQDGDRQAALADWTALLSEADAKEPWFADLTQRVAELGRELEVDVSARLRRDNAAAGGGVLALLDEPRPAAGADRDNAAAIGADIPIATAPAPADRSVVVRGMVESLAARLEQTPNDVEAWVKLIRSRKVLGEAQQAEQAFRRAMEVFKETPEAQAKIVAIGQEMGLVK